MNIIFEQTACETMGGVSDICTDKTGTLTYGSILLKKILLNFNAMNVETLTNNESINKNLLIKMYE